MLLSSIIVNFQHIVVKVHNIASSFADNYSIAYSFVVSTVDFREKFNKILLNDGLLFDKMSDIGMEWHLR